MRVARFKRLWLKPDSLVLTSRQVLSGAPVVLAAHMYSDGWQFIDASEKADDDARVVHFSDLLHLEPELNPLAGLRKGDFAFRQEGSPWQYDHFTSDEDFDRIMDSLG